MLNNLASSSSSSGEINPLRDIPKPRLFYWSEGTDCWLIVPHNVDHDLLMWIAEAHDLEEGQEKTVRVKRVMMTDAEVDALPEES